MVFVWRFKLWAAWVVCQWLLNQLQLQVEVVLVECKVVVCRSSMVAQLLSPPTAMSPTLAGVKILGPIPSGLQGFLDPLEGMDSATQLALLGNSISIALVGYMESMTIASTGA